MRDILSGQKINVVLNHKYVGSYEQPLEDWIRYGPTEPYMHTRPFRLVTTDGKKLSLRLIPLKYRNNWLARSLILWGILPEPWPEYKVRLRKFNQETKEAIKNLGDKSKKR